MNTFKTYIYEAITFKPVNSKWHFSNGKNVVIVACKGKEAAFKVDRAVSGGDKRTKGKGIDGLARRAINKILNPAVA